MATKDKLTVDYFPFLCSEGETVFCIEQKFGNDGYATWVKILRQLAVTENHFLDLSKKTSMLYLAAKCKVSIEILAEIIEDLVEFGDFNKQLWNDRKIIFCQKFINNIEDAYKRRNTSCMHFEDLCKHIAYINGENVNINEKIVDSNPHRIEENIIIENKRKKDNKEKQVFQPPSFFEVESFFLEKGFTSELAKRAFDFYDVAGWKDSKGNQVKNWKQKMLSVWLTEKNKNQENGTKPKLTRAQQQIQAGRENYERIIREAAARNAASDKGFSVPNENPTS